MSQTDVIYGFLVRGAISIPETANYLVQETYDGKWKSGGDYLDLSSFYTYGDGHPLKDKDWAKTNSPDSRAKGYINALNQVEVSANSGYTERYLNVSTGAFASPSDIGQGTYHKLITRNNAVLRGESDRDNLLQSLTALQFEGYYNDGSYFNGGEEASFPKTYVSYNDQNYAGALWHFSPTTATNQSYSSNHNAFKDLGTDAMFELKKPVTVEYKTDETGYFQDYLNVFHNNYLDNHNPLYVFENNPMFVMNFSVMEMATHLNQLSSD